MQLIDVRSKLKVLQMCISKYLHKIRYVGIDRIDCDMEGKGGMEIILRNKPCLVGEFKPEPDYSKKSIE